MRRVVQSPRDAAAVCADCGKRGPGCFWESFYKVLESGVPGLGPWEPGDLDEPVRCDECELRRRESERN